MMTVFKIGLQQNDILYSLNLNYLKNFLEMLEWAENYAQADEAWDQQEKNLGRTLH